jgi:type III restriction enzyme
VPGVNGLGTFGRWAFAELTDLFDIQSDFAAIVQAATSKNGAPGL